MKTFTFSIITYLLVGCVGLFAFSQDVWGDDTKGVDLSSGSKKEDEVAKKKEEPPQQEKTPVKEGEKSQQEDKKLVKKSPEPPKIGNFSLPASQQPSALVGFGGNIVDEGEIQLYFFAESFIGNKRRTTDMIPSVLFGITKDFSIYFNFPFTPRYSDKRDRSSGLEDFFLQVEYAFYNKSTYTYTDQATIVSNITFPTGSIKKNPPTGFGAPSVFFGATYYHMMVDWFMFVAPGAVLTTSDHGTKFGDQFLYQCGLGRNVPSPEGLIYAWMLELDGQYNKKNRIEGCIDGNSGGNVVYLTPSIWISTKKMLLQLGVGMPVNQNLFGKQRKYNCVLYLNFALSFY